MKTTLIAAMLLHAFTCKAQSILSPLTQPYLAITSYNPDQPDGFSYVNNVAGLSQCTSKKIGLYADQKFGLKELSHYAAAIVYPRYHGVFGFHLQYAGFSNYQEYKIGMAYSKSLGPKIGVGLQFFYQGYRIPAHRSGKALGYEAGVNIYLTNRFRCGLIMRNPYPLLLTKSENDFLKNERLSPEFWFGGGYDAGKNFHAMFQVGRIAENPVTLLSGFSYQFAQRFFIRAGISTGTQSFFAGAGIQFRKVQVHVHSSIHPQLGPGPGLLFLYDQRPNIESEIDLKTSQHLNP